MVTITLERQAETIERWKALRGVSGRDYVPANSGVTRTPEKRLLLKSLADDAKARNKEPRFSANY
jgi:hypothetical protein